MSISIESILIVSLLSTFHWYRRIMYKRRARFARRHPLFNGSENRTKAVAPLSIYYVLSADEKIKPNRQLRSSDQVIGMLYYVPVPIVFLTI